MWVGAGDVDERWRGEESRRNATTKGAGGALFGTELEWKE